MIATEIVSSVCRQYQIECNTYCRSPTRKGLSARLGVSATTIHRIICGEYGQGKPYTFKPHKLRCIDNDDFETVKTVFEMM